MDRMMAWSLDARIPVVFAPAAPQGAAVLAEAGQPDGGAAAVQRFTPGAGHVAGCSCCQGRNAAATALDLLFQARVRGTAPWFDRVVAVVATPEAAGEIRDALAGDALTAARFRSG